MQSTSPGQNTALSTYQCIITPPGSKGDSLCNPDIQSLFGVGRAVTAGQQSAPHPAPDATGCTGAADLLVQVADPSWPAHIITCQRQLPQTIAGVPGTLCMGHGSRERQTDVTVLSSKLQHEGHAG